MPINKKNLEEIKEKLKKEELDLKEKLNSFAKKNQNNSEDWNTKFPDFEAKGVLDEEADEVEEYTSLLPIEKTLELKLQNIKIALEKIKKNKYGKCEKCEKEIEEKRLKLIPETKFCNNCKK